MDVLDPMFVEMLSLIKLIICFKEGRLKCLCLMLRFMFLFKVLTPWMGISDLANAWCIYYVQLIMIWVAGL